MSVILKHCTEGSYKIVEIRDLIQGMLPKFKADSEGVAQIMKFLAANDMIDIKYNDESVFCIAVLPKGRIYEEARMTVKKDKALGKGAIVLIVIGSFMAAFLGSMLAGLILNW